MISCKRLPNSNIFSSKWFICMVLVDPVPIYRNNVSITVDSLRLKSIKSHQQELYIQMGHVFSTNSSAWTMFIRGNQKCIHCAQASFYLTYSMIFASMTNTSKNSYYAICLKWSQCCTFLHLYVLRNWFHSLVLLIKW